MSKGKRRERQAAALYERAGYETFRPQESKWGETDMFGLFDLLAVGPEPKPVHLIQVKSNRAEGVNEWSEMAVEYGRSSVLVGMMVCYDNDGWRFIMPSDGGRMDWFDERGSEYGMGELAVEKLRVDTDND